jgi:hypothetical protein
MKFIGSYLSPSMRKVLVALLTAESYATAVPRCGVMRI